LHYNFDKNPCAYFAWGKQKASTLSLTTLVMIEMFNAINALSEEKSLLQTGLFINMLLVIAICISFSLHLVIVYIPFFAKIFGTTPLSRNDWIITVGIAAPVVLLDEFVKIFARRETNERLRRLKEE